MKMPAPRARRCLVLWQPFSHTICPAIILPNLKLETEQIGNEELFLLPVISVLTEGTGWQTQVCSDSRV